MSKRNGSLDEREVAILEQKKVLVKRARNDQEVDAEFLFRFDTRFTSALGAIRSVMRKESGLEGDGSFRETELKQASEWWAHLYPDDTVNLEEWLTLWAMTTPPRRPPRMRFPEIFPTTRVMQRHLPQEVVTWVRAEGGRLGQNYAILPPPDLARRLFGRDDLRERWVNFVNFVLWAYPIPRFCWQGVRLVEGRFPKERVRRYILPFRAGEGNWQEKLDGSATWVKNPRPRQRPLYLQTRVRTWAVYYLTRRGGGSRTEAEGVELVGGPAEESNYRKQLRRLLETESPRG